MEKPTYLKGDFKMDSNNLVLKMYLEMTRKDLRDCYSKLMGRCLATRDILVSEFGMSKEEAQKLTQMMNEQERELVLGAANMADFLTHKDEG